MKIAIFCKTYFKDIYRATKLAKSICKYNKSKVPFFICLPKKDVSQLITEFNKNNISTNQNKINIITDEEVIKTIKGITLEEYEKIPGGVSQQIIKSEIWRFINCENYLCIDSDSEFIRNFTDTQFFDSKTDNLLTVMHDANEFLDEVKNNRKIKIINDYYKDSNIMKKEFERTGADYDFGPQPLLWSSKVWNDLQTKHLIIKGETIASAIKRIPMEIRWYGEALLKFKTIPIYPIAPLFKVYHYKWQKKSENLEKYIGIVDQSNWNKKLDYKKSINARIMSLFLK